jgi:hypothetical protein
MRVYDKLNVSEWVRSRHEALVACRQQRKLLELHRKPTVVRQVEVQHVHFDTRHSVQD